MYKKSKKTISICTVTSVLLTSALAGVKVSAATPPETPRLWGADRYETAVKISQAGWTTSEYAVIASGEGYADALCAAPLAKVNNAPILLTKRNELNEKTLKELKRLGVKHIYIIGGQGSVSNKVENKIKTLVTSSITRLAGRDRYETSVKVAEKLGKVDKVVLASGEGYADALSAAPVAAIKKIPVLLTKANELPGSTREYLRSSGATTTYVIGGIASVNDAVKGLVPGAERIYGQDRYETNKAVINAFATEFDFHKAYVALGSGNKSEFADALAGSAIAAKDAAPVVITGKTLSDATKEIAKEKFSPTSTITVLGGVKNVSNELIDSIKIKAAEYFDKQGTEYTKVVNGNAVAVAKDVKLKDTTVKGNLYIEGDNISVTNSTVEGTVYVNPGKDGVANLDGLTAGKIVVLSGAKDSIHFKNVKANLLNVVSRQDVRIVAESGTTIKSSVILSNAILEGNGGSFGEMKLAKTVLEKSVELRGNIDKTVVVEGKVNLKAAAGANIAKVEIRSASNDLVVLDGNLGTVEVYTAANIKVEKGAKATIIAKTEEAKSSAKIDVPKGADVKVQDFKDGNVTGDGAKDATTSVIGGGGSSSGGSGSYEGKYDITVTVDGYDKELKFERILKNASLIEVYSKVANDVKNNDNTYNLVSSAMNKMFNKAANINIKGQNSIDYVVSKLRAWNKDSKLADYIEKKENENIINYFAEKDLKEIYNMLDNKTGGDIVIPELEKDGAKLENIVIGNKTYNVGQTIKLAEVQEELDMKPTSKLDDLRSREITAVANFSNGNKYTLKSDGKGTITVEAMGKKATITIK
ncbi:cell wall-binding repeat-containing protein [Clostridium lundense]|uniref:cell wall-binding repeat-containing protein n=1 Tax=Clostridium lundense TaxID=319475 RepID=UPI0006879F48|nr:cell wall-binding repeat-containing protein [Clostridium lundense]